MEKEEGKEPKTPEGEQVTLSKKEYDELVLSKATLAQDKANLVNEIKELRQKNTLTSEEKATLENKLKELESMATSEDKEDIQTVAQKVVTQLMTEKEKKEREATFNTSLEEFKASNPEFSEVNDPAGLKLSAFMKRLSRYNLDMFKTKSDLVNLFEEVGNSLNPKPKEEDESEPDLPPSTIGKPKVVEKVILTDKESKLVNGSYYKGDKEKFLKDKAKKPDFIAQLLQYVN